MSNDPALSGRNGNHSPTSTTLLQQLGILLHRAVQAHSYGHDPKLLGEKFDAAQKRGERDGVLEVGYQKISVAQ